MNGLEDCKVGDLVEWKLDGDVGVIVDISRGGEICIHWSDSPDPEARFYYSRDHPTLRKVT